MVNTAHHPSPYRLTFQHSIVTIARKTFRNSSVSSKMVGTGNLFCLFSLCIKFGIIFGAHLSYGKKMFTLQKRIFRIMVGIKPRNDLFKRSKILPLPCEYTFSLVNLIVNNHEKISNSAVHSINTRKKYHLHRPCANLSCFDKSTYYAGINIFNSLPCRLRSLINENNL
jgi:hypothetical protein